VRTLAVNKGKGGKKKAFRWKRRGEEGGKEALLGHYPQLKKKGEGLPIFPTLLRKENGITARP